MHKSLQNDLINGEVEGPLYLVLEVASKISLLGRLKLHKNLKKKIHLTIKLMVLLLMKLRKHPRVQLKLHLRMHLAIYMKTHKKVHLRLHLSYTCIALVVAVINVQTSTK